MEYPSHYHQRSSHAKVVTESTVPDQQKHHVPSRQPSCKMASAAAAATANNYNSFAYGNYHMCRCALQAQTPKLKAAAKEPPKCAHNVPSRPLYTLQYANPSHQQECEVSRYSGYDKSNRITDEEDSAFPALLERELRALHRNIPALRRSGIDTSTIRQHYYPDGGWGWIICGMSFLAHVLTSGFQFSYGLLLFYAAQHLAHDSISTEWLGALSWAISSLSTPIVISFCRRKSTRLSAVLGGLALPLGILFTSFATHLTQVTFSYGILVGIGVSMVRESSTIMLGNYFKKRRQFVEMVAMSGEGVGITLFSVLLKEGVGKLGWRFGLQTIAGMASLTFFMGLLYRPASLYHPQRRAIQHLKNQRKKIKERKPAKDETKRSFLDLAPLKSTTVRILIMATAIASLGIFAPIFLLSLQASKEGCDLQDLVLLQACLGLSMTLGVVSSATLIKKAYTYKNVIISSQHVSQISIFTMSMCILCLSFIMGYRSLCVLSWIFGFGFGSYRYSFKALVLDRVRAKHFTKTWGLIRGAESLPVLISIPLTSFLNEYSSRYGRAGHYICSAACAIAGIVIFFIGYATNDGHNFAKTYGNGSITSNYVQANSEYPPDIINRTYPAAAYRYGHQGGYAQQHSHQCSPCTTLTTTANHQNFDQCNHFPSYSYNQRCCPATPKALPSQYCYNSLPRQTRQTSACTTLRNSFKADYAFGSGSVGAHAGRKLQKSLNNVMCTCAHGDGARAQMTNQRRSGHINYAACGQAQDPHLYYNHPSRSRSVPDGLSYTSEQCTCPSYNPYGQQHLVRQRSQSLSKHLHLVEQITTSL